MIEERPTRAAPTILNFLCEPSRLAMKKRSPLDLKTATQIMGLGLDREPKTRIWILFFSRNFSMNQRTAAQGCHASGIKLTFACGVNYHLQFHR